MKPFWASFFSINVAHRRCQRILWPWVGYLGEEIVAASEFVAYTQLQT